MQKGRTSATMQKCSHASVPRLLRGKHGLRRTVRGAIRLKLGLISTTSSATVTVRYASGKSQEYVSEIRATNKERPRMLIRKPGQIRTALFSGKKQISEGATARPVILNIERNLGRIGETFIGSIPSKPMSMLDGTVSRPSLGLPYLSTKPC